MSTIDFIKADFSSTLFPLKTNLLMAEQNEAEISNYIYQQVLNDGIQGHNFLAQQRGYATKQHGHLRRTLKLDPVAEYFLYDVIYRNRALFRSAVSDTRQSFGYRFKGGAQIPVHTAYEQYRASLDLNKLLYSHNLKFDIASYFNTLYHHDVSHWFASGSIVSEVDSKALGQFFREINAGRSVDFLPHGIYPSKMIGNEFLKFIDLSGQLKSACIIRFMDDFTLFDDDPDNLRQDFIRIQQLLGQYGLNINPEKTHYNKEESGVQEQLSHLQESLKEIVEEVREFHTASTVEYVEVETEIESTLTTEQIDGLLNLLRDEALEESDADLILGFLRQHSDSILEHIPTLLRKFPNLAKHIYAVCGTVSERAELAKVLFQYLEQESFFLEYQLFWLACIVEDYLLGVGCYGELLMKIYDLSQEFKLVRAKVLEVPEQGFGFKQIRGEYLKTGQSDWLSWASAMGTRSLKAGERNYALDYFSKASPMNFLIASCARKF